MARRRRAGENLFENTTGTLNATQRALLVTHRALSSMYQTYIHIAQDMLKSVEPCQCESMYQT